MSRFESIVFSIIGFILISALVVLLTSCEKEQVQPPAPTPTCKCGILTEKDWYIGSSGLVWKYRVRNECTNNNQWVNITAYIQGGGTTNIGDYVCAEYEW